MRLSFFHRNSKKQTTITKNADKRPALYAPIHVPGRNVPYFLPIITEPVYPSELQCRNNIAQALKSTYDSIQNAFAPDYEKNLATRVAEYYSISIQNYFYSLRLPMDLYFDALGKRKDFIRINTLVKNSKQNLLLQFQQLLMKRADLYKLHPLDEYVDLALYCETTGHDEDAEESKALCQPQPLQYKIVSVTEPWNRLHQTKRRMFEDFAGEAYRIYKDYMFEIECYISSNAAPAPKYSDGKEAEEFHVALAKYVKKHKKYSIAV